MAVAAMGLVPILPVMAVTPVVVIPVSVSIVKSFAVFKLTGELTVVASANGVDDKERLAELSAPGGFAFTASFLHPEVISKIHIARHPIGYNALKKFMFCRAGLQLAGKFVFSLMINNFNNLLIKIFH